VNCYLISRQASADLDRAWDYIADRASAEVATDFPWKFYGSFAPIVPPLVLTAGLRFGHR
jgi:plasmid stabilization system protein ParE